MAEMKKLAWMGDPGLKEEVLLRMKQHRAEDSIIQGKYQIYAPEVASLYKGCLLGCTLPMQERIVDGVYVSIDWHQEVQEAYGIPFGVALALESIFEGLPFEKAAEFAVDSIEAIPVGADLSGVMSRWSTTVASSETFYSEELAPKLLAILRNASVPEPAQ